MFIYTLVNYVMVSEGDFFLTSTGKTVKKLKKHKNIFWCVLKCDMKEWIRVFSLKGF